MTAMDSSRDADISGLIGDLNFERGADTAFQLSGRRLASQPCANGTFGHLAAFRVGLGHRATHDELLHRRR